MDAGGKGGSGNDSGGGSGSSGCCYYELLGVRKNASATDIRTAYRRLALKWHPDRCARDPGAAGEVKERFQRIQEAYSVLSDKGKRALYDVGLFDPLDDDDEVQGFSDFMQELLEMMDNMKNKKTDTLEDLQKMLDEIINDGGSSCGGGADSSYGGGAGSSCGGGAGSSYGGGAGSSYGGAGSSCGGVGGRVPSDGTRRTRFSPYPQPRR